MGKKRDFWLEFNHQIPAVPEIKKEDSDGLIFHQVCAQASL